MNTHRYPLNQLLTGVMTALGLVLILPTFAQNSISQEQALQIARGALGDRVGKVESRYVFVVRGENEIVVIDGESGKILD